MAHEWTTHELSEFISIKHGFAFKGEYFKDRETRDYLMTPGNFAIGGGFKGDKFKYYDGPVPEDYILQKGDLIITMTDLSKETDTLGYSALVPSISGRRLLHNQRVGLVEFKNAELDKMFLYFLLRSREYRHHVVSGATGTTVKHTSPTKIVSFQFRKPPLHMQKSIGERLIAIEEKIQLNRQTNQTLEAMAQALFKSWFVDFDPVIDNALAAGHEIPPELQARAEARKSLQARAEQRQASLSGDHSEHESGDILPESIRQLFPNRFVLDAQMGWIPAGWESTIVGQAFDVTMGQSPPGSTYNEEGEGLPFFQGKADFGFRFPTNRVYCTAPKRFASKGQTLISVRAPVGTANMAALDCCIGRGVAAVRHKSGSNSFTYYAMLQLASLFEKFNGEGTVFGSINQKDFNALPHLEPTSVVVSAFNNIAKPIDDRIEITSCNANELARTRDTLLPKLISGELRLPVEQQPAKTVIACGIP